MVALRTGRTVEGVLMGVYNPLTDETTWIDVTAVPLFRPGCDLPCQVYTTFQDITERRNAEAARRKSDERLHRHYELGLVGLAVTSPDKGWLEVNERLCQMLGYTRQELMATTWVELTHPDDRALDLEQFERVLAGEIDAYRLDKRFVRQDGSIVHVDLSVKCLRRPDGSGGGVRRPDRRHHRAPPAGGVSPLPGSAVPPVPEDGEPGRPRERVWPTSSTTSSRPS